jgi:hypothetical protein
MMADRFEASEDAAHGDTGGKEHQVHFFEHRLRIVNEWTRSPTRYAAARMRHNGSTFWLHMRAIMSSAKDFTVGGKGRKST